MTDNENGFNNANDPVKDDHINADNGSMNNGSEQNNIYQKPAEQINSSAVNPEPAQNMPPVNEQPAPQPNLNTQNQQPPFPYTWDGSSYNGTGPKKPKKGKGLKVFAATVTICLLLVLSMIGWAIYMGYVPNGTSSNSSESTAVVNDNTQNTNNQSTPNNNGTTSVTPVIKSGDTTIDYSNKLTAVYDKIKTSCVSVITDQALGSGFVVKENGYIITNHHVISGAKSLKVQFYDKKEYTAKLIGSDSVSDIAVLKIEGTFTPISLGNSDNLKVGQDVVAVGTPYDLSLAGTMSRGIVSGIARNVEVTNDAGIVVKTMTLIQTDTSINPGNSGGPLIDLDGQVIGINTMKLMEEYEGLGFSIPINNAVTIANTLIQYGKVDERPNDDFVTASPRLNITVMNVSDFLNKYELNYNFELPKGAVVVEIAGNSSIYKAGLELYDIITEFDGKAITAKEDLTAALKSKKAGDNVTIKVYRVNRNGESGDYHELSFKLDSAK